MPRSSAPPHLRVQRTRHGTFLYVDGSCASFFRRGSETTGGSWDLLAAPVLLVAHPRPRVLLLGVGAGTVIRILRALRPDAEIVAVDNDAEVLAVARREFALDALGAVIRCGDARRFVDRLPTSQRFDLVVDDIYAGSGDAMHKPAGWRATLRRALARLRPGGLLICNALDAAEARTLRDHLSRPTVVLQHADYFNHFLLAGRPPLPTARAVGRVLRAAPLLADAMRRTRITSV